MAGRQDVPDGIHHDDASLANSFPKDEARFGPFLNPFEIEQLAANEEMPRPCIHPMSQRIRSVVQFINET